MPTNPRGTYLPLSPPPAHLLPKAARIAVGPYHQAAARVAAARDTLDRLTAPLARAEAVRLDREAFKETLTASRERSDQLTEDITNAEQAVVAFTELAVAAEGALVHALRDVEGPDPEVQVERARQAFDDLLDAYAQERAYAAVCRWLADPTQRYAPGSTTQLEQDILRQRSYFRPADRDVSWVDKMRQADGVGFVGYDGPSVAYADDGASPKPEPYESFGVDSRAVDTSLVEA